MGQFLWDVYVEIWVCKYLDFRPTTKHIGFLNKINTKICSKQKIQTFNFESVFMAFENKYL